MRLAIVVSHPIQHFCPQYASIATIPGIELKVYFASAMGAKSYHDVNFKQEIVWKNLYLNEFDHVFLNEGKVLPCGKEIDAAEIENELNQFQPNLVIIYGYFQKLQRRVYRWSIKNKIRLGYISDSERRQERSFLKEAVLYPLKYIFFSRITYFFTVGDSNELYYQYYGVSKRKMIRMHFPIDIREYSQKEKEIPQLNLYVREKYGIESEAIVLGVVGKLVSWKSQEDLIEALIQLESSELRYHLFLVGSGPDQDRLKMKASVLKKNKVHFTGFVSPEELPGFYAACNIYVHPAMVEPHSLSISEAIYMHCPVIVSDRCGSFGPSDDVQDQYNGFVYPYKNIHALVTMIKRLSLDPALRLEFSSRSSKLGKAFQQRSHFECFEELIQKMA